MAGVTEGDDYDRVSVNLTFSGSMMMEEICHNVTTVDDNIVEDTEVFTISLTTSETMVIIPNSSAVISLNDNDSKSSYNDVYIFTLLL